MIETLKNYFTELTRKPKTIFLIDGIGALVTTILLFGVLRPFNQYFGMPRETLFILAIIAGLMAIYSFSCFVLLENNWRKWLRPIIVANSLYCILTIGFIIYFYPQLTILGLIYFGGEILVIFGIVGIELQTLSIFD